MESPSLEENVELLTDELCALMQINPKGGQEEKKMWSDIVKDHEHEVNELLNECKNLRNGRNKKNMQARDELNKKVIKEMKFVRELISNPSVVQSVLDGLGPKRYSREDIVRCTSKFEMIIGSGGYGKVYAGRLRGGVKVAVKVLEEGAYVEGTFIAEVSTMGSADHRHLIKLYGYCFDKSLKALVYEFMDRGSFDQILYNNPLGLEWEKFYEIAIAIAEGLKYLHHDRRVSIIHHDVKPANVLIDSNLSVKITDFGLAKLLTNNSAYRPNTGIRGTQYYMAPELFYPETPVSSKCDVYSFGMVLFEILRMKPNRDNEGWFPQLIEKKFKAGKLDEVLAVCGISEKDREKAKILSEVALLCAKRAPDDRPIMKDVVKMLQVDNLVKGRPYPLPEFSFPSMSPSRYGESSQASFWITEPSAESSVPVPATKEEIYSQKNVYRSGRGSQASFLVSKPSVEPSVPVPVAKEETDSQNYVYTKDRHGVWKWKEKSTVQEPQTTSEEETDPPKNVHGQTKKIPFGGVKILPDSIPNVGGTVVPSTWRYSRFAESSVQAKEEEIKPQPQVIKVFSSGIIKKKTPAKESQTATNAGGRVVESTWRRPDRGFPNRDSILESFQKSAKHPQGGEDGVVVYTTSLGAIRDVHDNCKDVLQILQRHEVKLIERDVYIEDKYLKEVRDILGGVQLPAVFVDSRFIGGAADVMKMEEEGKLRVLFDEIKKQRKR